jgi:NADP-dependent 3-hydroxy acid dehydrogenase YdfG
VSSKVVVITGASGGIGAALARALGRRGCLLALAARRQDELVKVAQESSSSSLAVVTDVTVRSDVERLFIEARERFGKIDVWVNNAGRGLTKTVLQLTDADVDDMIQANVKSVLYGMQAVIPYFKERGEGQLINISSFLAKKPIAPFRSAYSAAKAAVNSLSETLRYELAAQYPKISITVVMPGLVSTEFAVNARTSTSPQVPPPKNIPPPQTPEEVANAIAGAIEQPVSELFTNPASIALLRD